MGVTHGVNHSVLSASCYSFWLELSAPEVYSVIMALSHSWRLLGSDETVFYGIEVGGPVGYVMHVVFAGHSRCGCMCSHMIRIFHPHDLEDGPWPVHYTVSDGYPQQFSRAHPELECLSGMSYVSIAPPRYTGPTDTNGLHLRISLHSISTTTPV
jgi:hypothetical protein